MDLSNVSTEELKRIAGIDTSEKPKEETKQDLSSVSSDELREIAGIKGDTKRELFGEKGRAVGGVIGKEIGSALGKKQKGLSTKRKEQTLGFLKSVPDFAKRTQTGLGQLALLAGKQGLKEATKTYSKQILGRDLDEEIDSLDEKEVSNALGEDFKRKQEIAISKMTPEERKGFKVGQFVTPIVAGIALGGTGAVAAGVEAFAERITKPTQESLGKKVAKASIDAAVATVLSLILGVVGEGIKKLKTKKFGDIAGDFRKIAQDDEAIGVVKRGIKSSAKISKESDRLIKKTIDNSGVSLNKVIDEGFNIGKTTKEISDDLLKKGGAEGFIKVPILQNSFDEGLSFNVNSTVPNYIQKGKKGIPNPKFNANKAKAFKEGVHGKVKDILFTNIDNPLAEKKSLKEAKTIIRKIKEHFPKEADKLLNGIEIEEKIFKNLTSLLGDITKKSQEQQTSFLGKVSKSIFKPSRVIRAGFTGIVATPGTAGFILASELIGEKGIKIFNARTAKKLITANTPKKISALARVLSDDIGRKVTSKEVSDLAKLIASRSATKIIREE